jgi:hypothetical protein
MQLLYGLRAAWQDSAHAEKSFFHFQDKPDECALGILDHEHVLPLFLLPHRHIHLPQVALLPLRHWILHDEHPVINQNALYGLQQPS